MQSFFELEQKLLNEHGSEYNSFTRLLLTITVACITILASTKAASPNILFIVAFVLLFISLLFGILVQHRIMMNPIYHLELAQKQLEEAEKAGSSEPINLRRKPSKLEEWFYRLQAASFVLAFFMLAVYFVGKVT